jgi:hypothetical protein
LSPNALTLVSAFFCGIWLAIEHRAEPEVRVSHPVAAPVETGSTFPH